jgi:serine/threonine protein kinase
VTHSPNLGIDFYQLFDIFTNSQSPGQKKAKDKMERVRAIPFETIMKGIGEMLRSLVILNTNKKIHKDVRLENMMFNPTTGIIKLIDFDEMIDMDREMIDDWKIPSRLMNAFPPEMALWNSKDSTAFEVSVNKKIDYLLDPKTSFTKCTKEDEKEIIELFTLRLTIWKRQLEVLTDMYKTQNTRKSIAYLFKLHTNMPENLAEYLLTEMGKSMDKLTDEKILDVNERRFRMKNKSAGTVDSYCMSYCLMVFLGMYLDDAKWADHGATLDKLFKNILIPLYKINVYYDKDAPLKERLLSRAGIMNVLDGCRELFPDSFPSAAGRSGAPSSAMGRNLSLIHI